MAGAAPLETLQQPAQVFRAASGPVKLGYDHTLYLACLYPWRQSGHAGPPQALGGLAPVHDDSEQLGIVHQGI